jgi:hypothetical protein
VTETSTVETVSDQTEIEPTAAAAGNDSPEEPETFNREDVQKLRDEAAGHPGQGPGVPTRSPPAW